MEYKVVEAGIYDIQGHCDCGHSHWEVREYWSKLSFVWKGTLPSKRLACKLRDILRSDSRRRNEVKG